MHNTLASARVLFPSNTLKSINYPRLIILFKSLRQSYMMLVAVWGKVFIESCVVEWIEPESPCVPDLDLNLAKFEN